MTSKENLSGRLNGKEPPTQERVKELLIYDPDTGIFIWRVDVGRWGRIKAGTVTGSLCGNGYLYISFDGERFVAHNLAWLYMTGEWPNGLVDHINMKTTDNRFSNLRLTDRRGNAENNKAKLKPDYGVYKHKHRYKVQFYVNQKNTHFGLFDTFTEAIEAAQKIRSQLGI